MHSRELILQGLTTSGWFWFCAAVCAVAAVLVGLLLKYERTLVSARVGNTLLALRLSVLALLCLTFLQPVATWVLDRDRSARIVIAVDVSESMDTADTHADKASVLRWARSLELIGNSATDARLDRWISELEGGQEPTWVDESEAPTEARRDELTHLRKSNVEQVMEAVRALPRREIATRLLNATSQSLLAQLKEIGVVEIRAFAAKSETLDESLPGDSLSTPIPALVPQQTNLSSATDIGTTDDTSKVMGVVLLTDGRHNTGQDPMVAAERLGTLNIPLIPVMIGSELRPKDISIISLEHPQVVFQNDTPVLKARLAADGFRNEELTVVLKHPDGTEESRQVRVPPDTAGAPFVDVDFPLDAKTIGRDEYQLRTAVQDGETRDDNNQRSFAIQIVDDQAHVLLVDGEARWEFRFIDNALSRDERIDLKRVVFEQPHIGVLPTTFFPPKLDLPERPEDVTDSEMAELDLLIVGDVSPNDVTEDSWKVIDQFVREQGGTLVLLAGKNQFPVKHRSKEMQQLFPVTNLREINLTQSDATSPPLDRGFRLDLTPDAERQAMFQFDTDAVENRRIWSQLPGHLWGFSATARPGATVYAVARRPAEPSLAYERENAMIVHQYYGFGQVLWVGIDSTWRWRHRVGDKYHHRFWAQLARWAARNKASAGNEFVRMLLQSSQLEVGDDAVFEVRWQKRFLDLNPQLKAALEIYRESEGSSAKPFSRIELSPVEGSPLLFQARAVGLPSGTWTAKLAVTDANLGSEVRTSLYVSDPLTGELSDLSANRDLLTRLAEASGGQLLLPDEVHRIDELLKPPEEASQSREETTLWDHWIFMLLFFALLTTEWVVRKLNGLP
ncbi:MAG: hypothetical protein O3B13_03990 [Planctomycetota bacterium]|nr:hypothetical protein [Planctomycetota bacterium]